MWGDADWLGGKRAADKGRHGFGIGSYVPREAHRDLIISCQRQSSHPNPGEQKIRAVLPL